MHGVHCPLVGERLLAVVLERSTKSSPNVGGVLPSSQVIPALSRPSAKAPVMLCRRIGSPSLARPTWQPWCSKCLLTTAGDDLTNRPADSLQMKAEWNADIGAGLTLGYPQFAVSGIARHHVPQVFPALSALMARKEGFQGEPGPCRLDTRVDATGFDSSQPAAMASRKKSRRSERAAWAMRRFPSVAVGPNYSPRIRQQSKTDYPPRNVRSTTELLPRYLPRRRLPVQADLPSSAPWITPLLYAISSELRSRRFIQNASLYCSSSLTVCGSPCLSKVSSNSSDVRGGFLRELRCAATAARTLAGFRSNRSTIKSSG